MFGFLTLVLYIEHYIYYKNLMTSYKYVAILIGYAVCTEILQYMSGYRSFDIFDICADVVGIILAVMFANILYKKKFPPQ